MEPLLTRHAVQVTGPADGPAVVLVHGFGGDSSMWSRIVPAFADTHRVITYDHAGCGATDRSGYDAARYAHLDAYVDDLAAIITALDLADATVIGHSIGGAMALCASTRVPDRIRRVAVIGSSARYLDDDGYVGGFSQDDIRGVLAAIDDNYLAWATAMAPTILATPDRPDLEAELEERFHRIDPAIAATFARATFLTDIRDVLPQVTVPTRVLHCTDDAIVPDGAAAYLHRHLAASEFVQLRATGHWPLLTAPHEAIDALDGFAPHPVAAG